MKRILYMVACDIGLTGTPLFVRDVANAVNDRYEVLVYTPFRQTRKVYPDDVKVLEGHCKGKGLAFYRELRASLKKLIRDVHIDIVHINTSNLLFTNICVDCFYGKVPLIISHSHSVINYEKDLAHKLLVPYMKKNIIRKSHRLLACSDATGKRMFGSDADYRVIHNFIDPEKFTFSQAARNEVRKDKPYQYILGNVGGFNSTKNQVFLIELAKKLDERFCLMLIGNGGLKAECKRYCLENDIQNVYFVDACENIHEYYSAFDILLFPSRGEGFGRVLLEAEASNLNKIASIHVPPSEAFTCKFLPLDQKLWIRQIYTEIEELNERFDNTDKIERSGFSTGAVISDLVSIYES